MAKASEIRASLLRHAGNLSAAHHDLIVHGLISDGFVVDGDRGDVHAVAAGNDDVSAVLAAAGRNGAVKFQLFTPNMAAAADERAKVLLCNLAKECARWGYHGLLEKPDEVVKLHEIDSAFKASACPFDTRMRLKSNLAALNLVR